MWLCIRKYLIETGCLKIRKEVLFEISLSQSVSTQLPASLVKCPLMGDQPRLPNAS